MKNALDYGIGDPVCVRWDVGGKTTMRVTEVYPSLILGVTGKGHSVTALRRDVQRITWADWDGHLGR